jgi:hypothetical protein
MLLFRHGGKTSSIPPPSGGLTVVVVATALRGKEYHVVAAVEGHELETPKMEQREEFAGDYPSRAQREVVRQHAAGPYLARQLSVFRPRGVPGSTSKIVAACPSPDGLARDGTQGGKTTARVILRQGGCACSRGYKRSRGRERERACSLARPPERPPSLPREGPGPSFYRCKERVQVYNGGVAIS